MSKDQSIVTVERHHMIAAMASAGVVETRNTIPILSNILIAVEGGRLRVTGTDLDMWAEISVPAVGPDWSATVDAKRLAALVGATDEGAQIGIQFEADARDLVVRAGRSRYKLPILPAGDFPLPEFTAGEASMTIAAKSLATGLSRIEFAQSNNPMYFYLNGALLAVRDGDLLVAATDRLIMADATIGEGVAGWGDAILPTKVVAQLIRLMKDHDGDVTLTANHDGTRLRFEWGDWSVTTKLLIGDFPPHRKVIPPATDRRVAVDAMSLSRALKRVTMMSADKTVLLTMGFGKDRLTLSCSGVNTGEGEEELAAECPVDDLTVTLNARQFASMIAATSGDTVVLYPGEKAMDFIRFEPAVHDGFVGVLSAVAA